MPKDKVPKIASVQKFKSLEEQSQEILEAADELQDAIYECLYSLQNIGASEQEIIGLLFDMQCRFREGLYDEE